MFKPEYIVPVSRVTSGVVAGMLMFIGYALLTL